MKTVVRSMTVVVAAVVLIAMVFAAEARAEKKISIFLFSDEARYIETKNAIQDQLKKGGFAEPAVKFTVESAGGNKAKAAEIAQKISASNPDMVVAIGTSAAVAAAKEIKTIPLVFSMVYDPVDSKIAESWTSSGNNTTGSSPRIPMAKILGIVKQVALVKKIAVLYTPGEKNSETQLKDVQAEQAASGIKIMPVPLSTKDEVAAMMGEVVSSADAVYLTGSSIVGATLSTIVDAAAKAKVITVTHLDDYVEKGALLGVCADSSAVGRLAGEKAVKILKGTKPSSLPIEVPKNADVVVNAKTARASQIQFSAELKKIITKTIE